MKKILSLLLVLGLVLVSPFSNKVANATGLINGKNLRADVSSSEVTITNTPSVASDIIINGGNDIILTEGGPTDITISATITDPNGCNEVTSVIVRFYQNSSTGNSTPNDNYRYAGNATEDEGTCTGSDDPISTWSITFPIAYYANPTDQDADYWIARFIPVDAGVGVFGGNTAEVLTLKALDVTETIDFGTISAGESTGETSSSVVVSNSGNAEISLEVDGSDMTCTTGSIPVGNIKLGPVNTNFSGLGAVLTGTAALVDAFTMPKRVDGGPASANYDLFWGLEMPATGVSGSCAGTINFTAI